MFGFSLITGFLASLLYIGKYIVKEKRALLIISMGIFLFFGVTFLMLGSNAGAIISMLIGIEFMAVYFYKIQDKDFPNKALIGFIVAFIIFEIFTFKDIFDIIPLIVAFICTYYLYNDNRTLYRILELINFALWSIYSVHITAYTILVGTFILIALYLVDIYRFDIKKETEPMVELELNFAEDEKEKRKEEENTDNILLTSSLLSGERKEKRTIKKVLFNNFSVKNYKKIKRR